MDLSQRGQGDGREQQQLPGGPPVPIPPAAATAVSDDPGSGSQNVEEMVTAIMQMGINRDDALLAVRQTGAVSVEAAIAWVFENRDIGEARLAEEGIYQEYKMVFVVNGSLPMSIGKIAAQVGHASIDLYRLLVSRQEEYGGSLLQWDENGSKKIALRAETTESLQALSKQADDAGLPNTVIRDAGLTQIPGGSLTVLGIFGPSSGVDKVTGQLKLL